MEGPTLRVAATILGRKGAMYVCLSAPYRGVAAMGRSVGMMELNGNVGCLRQDVMQALTSLSGPPLSPGRRCNYFQKLGFMACFSLLEQWILGVLVSSESRVPW